MSGLLLVQISPLKAAETQTSTQDKKFGAGLMLGEPTGASLKYWFSDVSAIDSVIGLSFDDDDFSFHADYLYHFKDLFQLDQNQLVLYVGGGPRYRARDHEDDLFGIRVVGGLSYIFDDLPLDIFLEAGPVFDFEPEGKVRYTVGVGARYWF
jgi:hypothetical protein